MINNKEENKWKNELNNFAHSNRPGFRPYKKIIQLKKKHNMVKIEKNNCFQH